jgi:hypothetical protein
MPCYATFPNKNVAPPHLFPNKSVSNSHLFPNKNVGSACLFPNKNVILPLRYIGRYEEKYL